MNSEIIHGIGHIVGYPHHRHQTWGPIFQHPPDIRFGHLLPLDMRLGHPPPATDIWWSSLEAYSNLRTCDLIGVNSWVSFSVHVLTKNGYTVHPLLNFRIHTKDDQIHVIVELCPLSTVQPLVCALVHA